MKNDSNLPIGEKIKQIRSAKGISQENMARAIKSNQSYVYRLEQGQAECSTEMLAAIKKFLEIENAPLMEHEISMYRHRIWVWIGLLDTNRFAEAKDVQSELSSILDLPFEHDLCFMFNMVKAAAHLKEFDMPAAMQTMDGMDDLADGVSNAALYMYHRNKGIINALHGDNKSGLKHFLHALDFESDKIKVDGATLSNIGVLYLGLGRPYNAMIYLERAYKESQRSHAYYSGPHITAALASAYMYLGEYKNAKRLFDTAYDQAKSIGNDMQIELTLLNLSLLNIKMGNYEEGVECCNQALTHIQKSGLQNKKYTSNKGLNNSPQCIMALFNKGLGLLKMKEFAQCQGVLDQGKALAKGDEKASIMFDTLRHFTTLKESNSEKYIEDIAIPYFRAGDGSDKLMILDLCKDLEAHYKKKRAKIKALSIAAIIRDIYEEMYTGEIEL